MNINEGGRYEIRDGVRVRIEQPDKPAESAPAEPDKPVKERKNHA